MGGTVEHSGCCLVVDCIFLFVIIGDLNLLYFTGCREFQTSRNSFAGPCFHHFRVVWVGCAVCMVRVMHGGADLSRSIGALDQDPMMLQILIATDPGLHLFADGDW